MKTLHLLRHAKSDWSDPTLADHDRPLTQRGKRARRLVAEHVRGWPVDLVVSSTAKRARATAKPVVETLGCPVRYDAAVYEADVDGLLDVIRSLPDDAARVVLVGHNPGFEDLHLALCGSPSRYPTAALGTLELAVDDWRDVQPGCARCTALVTPADLGPPDAGPG